MNREQENIENSIKEASQHIQESDAILITAGAGMGVDSGLPDFRGKEGFWKAYPIAKKLGLSFEEMANPIWFRKNPKLAWAFYGHRLNLYRKTIPHEGFAMLLDLVKEKQDNYFIFTSNVDGQFQKAGFDTQKIYEVHGSIHHFQCVDNCKRDIWEADAGEIEIDMEKFEAITIPKCRNCSSVARPNILMFGDLGWNSDRTYQQHIRFEKWIRNIKKENRKLSIVEIGAGTAIATVRMEGEQIALIHDNAKLIRINPRDYDIDEKIGYSIPYGGLQGLKMILQR